MKEYDIVLCTREPNDPPSFGVGAPFKTWRVSVTTNRGGDYAERRAKSLLGKHLSIPPRRIELLLMDAREVSATTDERKS